MRRHLLLIAALGLLGAACVSANDAPPRYQGAHAILQALAAQRESGEPAGTDAVSALLRDLRAYRAKAAGMPPEEAAKGWLSLADGYTTLSAPPGTQGPNGTPLQFQQILQALPPP